MYHRGVSGLVEKELGLFKANFGCQMCESKITPVQRKWVLIGKKVERLRLKTFWGRVRERRLRNFQTFSCDPQSNGRLVPPNNQTGSTLKFKIKKKCRPTKGKNINFFSKFSWAWSVPLRQVQQNSLKSNKLNFKINWILSSSLSAYSWCVRE